MNEHDGLFWFSLGHGENIPELLHALASPEATAREKAWSELVFAFRGDGDVSPAAAMLVPSLLALLATAAAPAKAEFLRNLCLFAGDDDDSAIGPYSPRSPRTVDDATLRLRRAVDAGLPIYAPLLDDRDPDVRAAAGRALTLCFSQYDEVARRLREKLPDESDELVQAIWMLQFAAMDRASDVPFVAEIAEGEGAPLVRFAAAIAWACLAPKKLSSSAAMILEAGCRPEHDFLSRLPREERYVAAAVQRATKAPQVGRLILLALLNSPTEEVRNTAMLQLLETPDCPPEAIAKLTTLLKDGSVATRQWAAFRIASALDEPIIRARERGRFAASEKLARQLEELARPFVAALTAQLAVEDDPGARLAMCHALKHLALWGAPAAAVLKSLENVEHNARAALWVMEVLHHGSPVELVERFNERGRIAWMAERVLLRKAQSQPQPIVAALSDGLESPAADWIAAVLGHLGPVAASAVPALQRALNHRESTVRKAAAAALARIDPRVASGPLQLDEKTIRESLGAIVPPELPKLIGRLLNDANVNEQYAALRAIAELGSAALPARSYLLAATEKGWLYYNAFGALSRVEPELVRPRMRELMSFYRSDDRRKFPTQPDAFVQYLGPELQADAIELLLECLATTDETATAGRLAMVAAVSGLRLADPRLLQPLIERLLRLDWRGERKRGIDPRSQILHCLNREGVRFSALVPVVGEFVGDAQLGPLAMETLSRMGSWTDVLPFIEPFLATTDQERRKASDQAVARLGRLATADQLPSLEAALTHESVVVSRAARAAAKRLKDVE